MRKLLAMFAVALLAVPGLIPSAKAEVTVDVFYESLEPHGEWIEAADYGYVWHPRNVDAEWRPYTVGNWAYTDAGWTWVSEEPFGWATYHYGRWVEIDSTGWVWVPDTEWGPAWVSWRRSPKHIGWAPLPPEASFQPAVGIKTWSDSYYDVGPTYYSFVEVRQFGSPSIRTVILPPRENITIIRETRNITNITVVNNIVFNGGPEYDVIVRESAQPIRRLRLERRTDIAYERGAVRDDIFRTRIAGDSLQIAAPEIRFRPEARPQRVARRIETVKVDRGWEGVSDRGQAEQLRAAIKKEAPKPPAELPPQPRFQRLAERAEARAKQGEAAPDRPGAPGDRQAADRDRPMRDAATAPAADPSAPAAPKIPDATVGAPESPDAPPAARPARPGERPDAAERAKRAEDRKKAGAATPDAAAVPAEKDAPTERMRDEKARPGRKPAPAPGEGLSVPEGAAPPPDVQKKDATPADAKKKEDKPDRRGRDREPAETSATEPERAKPSAERPEAAPKPEADMQKERSRARTQSEPSTSAERGERPSRPDRPERTATPDRPDRPERQDRPERAPAAVREPSTRTPEAESRPERPERSEPKERPERRSAPDRPSGGPAAGAERIERPDRPKAEGPGEAGKPDARGEGERPGRPR